MADRAVPAGRAAACPLRILRDFLERQHQAAGVRGLLLGVSGGLDSRVLLAVAAAVAPGLGLSLRAVHVHHGLSPHADAWADHVAAWCAHAGVPLAVHRVRVARDTASLENAARAARHAAFAAELCAGDALLLAQHRDDQAETLLFRLLRGAGLDGLGAMRARSLFTARCGLRLPLWRPFLGLARADLEAFARGQGLDWIDDESNADLSLDRNYLRHEVLPRLSARWPASARTLADTAARLQEAGDLLDELAAELAATAMDARGRLSVDALRALSPARQRLLLRHWLCASGGQPPSAAVLERLRADMTAARADAMPCVAWPGTEVRRYRDRLYRLMPSPPLPAGWSAEWDGVLPLALPDGRRLRAEGEGRPARTWRVRYREGGERLRPRPGQPSRELRTWLQEQEVPPWERERLPLVLDGDDVIGVGELPVKGAWRFRLETVAGDVPGITAASAPERERR